MDKEILEQLQLLNQGMAQMEQRLSQEIKDVESRVEERIRESEHRTEQRIQESEVRTRVMIENKVTARIDALVDGYKSAHEKQWELEHVTEQMRSQIEDLQNRVAALENKTA